MPVDDLLSTSPSPSCSTSPLSPTTTISVSELLTDLGDSKNKYTPAIPINLEHEAFPLPPEMIVDWHPERAATFVTLDWADAELLGYPREVFSSQEVREAETNIEFSDIIDRLGGQQDAEPHVSADMPEEAPFPLLEHLLSPPHTPRPFPSHIPDFPTPPPDDDESIKSETWHTFCKAKSWVADDQDATPPAPSPLEVCDVPVLPKEEVVEGHDMRDEREVSDELEPAEDKANVPRTAEEDSQPVDDDRSGSLEQLGAMYPSSPPAAHDEAESEMGDQPVATPTPLRFTKPPSPLSRARTWSPDCDGGSVPSSPPTLRKATAPTSPLSPLLTPVESTPEARRQRPETIKRSISEDGPSRTPHLGRTRARSDPVQASNPKGHNPMNALALEGMGEVVCKVTLVDTRADDTQNPASPTDEPIKAETRPSPTPAPKRKASGKRKRDVLGESVALVSASQQWYPNQEFGWNQNSSRRTRQPSAEVAGPSRQPSPSPPENAKRPRKKYASKLQNIQDSDPVQPPAAFSPRTRPQSVKKTLATPKQPPPPKPKRHATRARAPAKKKTAKAQKAGIDAPIEEPMEMEDECLTPLSSCPSTVRSPAELAQSPGPHSVPEPQEREWSPDPLALDDDALGDEVSTATTASTTPWKSTLKKPTPLSKAYCEEEDNIILAMCPLREAAYKESEMREVSEQLEKAGYQPRSVGALRWRITHKLRKDLTVDN